MKLNKVVGADSRPKSTEVRLTVVPADAQDPSVRKVISPCAIDQIGGPGSESEAD